MHTSFKKCMMLLVPCIYLHIGNAGMISSRTLHAPANASTVVVVGIEKATQASNDMITLLLEQLETKKGFVQKIPCIVQLPPLSPENEAQYEKYANNVAFKRIAEFVQGKKDHHIFSIIPYELRGLISEYVHAFFQNCFNAHAKIKEGTPLQEALAELARCSEPLIKAHPEITTENFYNEIDSYLIMLTTWSTSTTYTEKEQELFTLLSKQLHEYTQRLQMLVPPTNQPFIHSLLTFTNEHIQDVTSLEKYLTGDNTTSLWYYLIKQIDSTFGNSAFLNAILDHKTFPLTFLIISEPHAKRVTEMLIHNVAYTAEEERIMVAEGLSLELIRYWFDIDALLERARRVSIALQQSKKK